MRERKWTNRVLAALLVLNLVATICLALMVTVPSAPLSELPGIAPKTRYTLYIGLNDKDTDIQQISTDEAKALVDGIMAGHTDGFTASLAWGGWTDDAGGGVRENTLIYRLYDVEEAQVTAILDEVLSALNQSAVLVAAEDTLAAYYAGGGTGAGP